MDPTFRQKKRARVEIEEETILNSDPDSEDKVNGSEEDTVSLGEGAESEDKVNGNGGHTMGGTPYSWERELSVLTLLKRTRPHRQPRISVRSRCTPSRCRRKASSCSSGPGVLCDGKISWQISRSGRGYLAEV